ncbi:S-Adenosylmethionine:tRNA-ribosyltransferase-isomerase (queuine synthetase) [Elusimicrobium minutum Pei191]|uniref:S-adenosylmethionine:tRNA ribosyltransferase-isomerase n=1 Tax=Elusimicrobium minutum (strain Pei191) TaxID=445932 RepID=B2KCE2_ELUMP|nr:tRNA preQ1(34) S-adenosylmethionine ribosyltransferase-isomerase QueA [Elusimicrobium minutum]ACC98063.1 S-Adenosylmethionine:tRNA-ribosyltransferase-isomerase (queuine synthetase) [Elusimicrobium minutum Pei191]
MFERFHNLKINIARTPATPRDSAKLMVLNRDGQKIEHRIFRDISQYFTPGDCLVINDTKVFPAKLFAKKPTGGKVEVLLVRPLEKPNEWTALMRDYKEGIELSFSEDLKAVMDFRNENGEVILKFNNDDVLGYACENGLMPLPQYIEKARKHDGLSASIETDKERYQTVYAQFQGSIAAPTAGFHFTPELLKKIEDKGVKIARVTLHIGWGTFKPLKTDPKEHKMLAEYGTVSEEASKKINEARASGGRIFSVGTTSTRTLESFTENGITKSGGRWTDLFIYPGYKFKAIDCLITNFHFPDSTPLCMASAFASEDFIFKAYNEAVENNYRFYSFGDSMLIL